MATSADSLFCPYKGLQPYTEADRKYFFGRTRDQGIITSNLYASPLTVFYGASGVGKSSVLLAGVVPQLRQEPRDAVVVVFNSWQGGDFLSALKSEVAKQASVTPPVDDTLPLDEFLAQSQRALGIPLFLIFDQFEEYFLYHPPSLESDAFEASLARSVNLRSIQVNFFLSLREDGLSKLDRFQGRLPRLLNNMLRLGHLDRDSAREAITKPLDQYNRENGGQPPITIEDALVDAVLNDLSAGNAPSDQVGQGQVSEKSRSPAAAPIETPFLQMVMTRLWYEEIAKGSRELRLQTYDALGRAENIARTHLDTMMARLTEPERKTTANILRYLVTPAGTKIAQEAGALASWSELPPAEVQAILDRLSAQDMRILRTVQAPGQPVRYEIFHDVLAQAILNWRARYVQEQKLLEAERQMAIERAKIAEQLERQRLQTKRSRLIAVGLLLLTVVMIVLAYNACVAKRTARSRELAAYSTSLLKEDPELSLLLAIEAVNQTADDKSINALKRALLESHVSVELRDSENTAAIRSVAFSPDGKYVVTARWNTVTPQVWDSATGKYLGSLKGPEQHSKYVNSASFSNDGKYVVTASRDNTARVWEGWQTAMPQVVATLSESKPIWTAAFSPDGEYVLTGGEEGKVHVWEWKNQRSAAELTVWDALSKPELVSSPSPTPTPASSASHGATASPAPAPSRLVYKAAFSPDGQLIVIAAKINVALIWEWKKDRSVNNPLKLLGHRYTVYDAAFSSDGDYAVTGSFDNTAIVWDWRNSDQRTNSSYVLNLLPSAVRGVAFSPDGKFVATVSEDRLARLWEWRVSNKREDTVGLRGHKGIVFCVAFSHDGKFVATGSEDGTARVWLIDKLDEEQLNRDSPNALVKLAQERLPRQRQQLTDAEKKKYLDQ
jgi:WD40 repeat protein